MTNLFAMLFAPEQLLIVLVIVLVLFGGKKIPELMRGVGRGVGELQKGLDEGKRALHQSIQEEANKPAEAVAATPDAPVSSPPPAAK